MASSKIEYRPLLALIALAVLFGCSDTQRDEAASSQISFRPASTTIEQLIPRERLDKIRAALPKVAFAELERVLASAETLWFNHDVMTPSYQDSLGAQSNATWPDLVAASEAVIGGLHDRSHHRWQFPFATTAGTDDAVNVQTVKFIHLPHRDGRPLSIPIWEVLRNYDRPQWMWVYPNGTMIGEVIFITQGTELLPTEIRIRTRYPDGWTTNAFRPFTRAVDLASEVKRRRPDWSGRSNLKRLVEHLENVNTLTPKTLAARAALEPTFRQSGALDILPDFADAPLVKELLSTTTFVSAYGAVWKEQGGLKAYAASTNSDSSIVPSKYEAGIIEVSDVSCMRCHKETGRLVSEFYFDLYLYGELWGKDGIFSFHPFDESLYPQLRTGNDNRQINPRLRQMGVFEPYDTTRHIPPLYPPRPAPTAL